MLSEYRKKKLKRLFTFYDANKNQSVETSDIDALVARFVKEFGWTSQGEVAGVFKKKLQEHWFVLIDEADVNRDKKVTYEEFLDFYNVALSNDGSFFQSMKPLFDALYMSADPDMTGVISKKHFIALYRAMGNPQEQAEKAFRKLDKNDDSRISHLELYSAFYHFFMGEQAGDPSEVFFGQL